MTCPECEHPWDHHWTGDTGDLYCPSPAIAPWVVDQIAGIVGVCEAVGFSRERIVALIKKTADEL